MVENESKQHIAPDPVLSRLVFFVFAIGRRLFSPKVGLVAARSGLSVPAGRAAQSCQRRG